MPKTTTTGPYKGKLPPNSKKALKKYKKVNPNPRKRGKPPTDRRPVPPRSEPPIAPRTPYDKKLPPRDDGNGTGQSNYGGGFKEWLRSPEGQAMMPSTFQADGTGQITRGVTDKLWEGWQKGLRGKQLSGWYSQQKPGAGPGPIQGEDNQDPGQKPGTTPPIQGEDNQEPIPGVNAPGTPPTGAQAGPSAPGNVPPTPGGTPAEGGPAPPPPGGGPRLPGWDVLNPGIGKLDPNQAKELRGIFQKYKQGTGERQKAAYDYLVSAGVIQNNAPGGGPTPPAPGTEPPTPGIKPMTGGPLGVQGSGDPYQAALGGAPPTGGMGPINPPPENKPELTGGGVPPTIPGQSGQYGGINPGGQEPPSETSGAPAGVPINPNDPRFKKFGQKNPGIDFMGPM